MKIKFREIKLSPSNKKKLERINVILEKYMGQGYQLTLRQLYYRLVIENAIPNKANEYKKLMHLLGEGRMAGIVDWDAIEDRVRSPYLPYHVDHRDEVIKEAAEFFKLDRQKGQPNYIELWVEKDAISNILKPRTALYGIRLMVNRGYSSTSAMYESFKRIERAIKRGQNCHIIYLGDHDPSGLHMSHKDIPDRLNEAFGTEVAIKHIGITKKQIEQFELPPNPAKITDPRAGWYIENHGESSWEVDALEPDELHKIINREIENLMDMDKYNLIMKQEAADRIKLRRLPAIEGKHYQIRKYLENQIDGLTEQVSELNLDRDLERIYLTGKIQEMQAILDMITA